MAHCFPRAWTMAFGGIGVLPTKARGKTKSWIIGEASYVGSDARGAVVWCSDGEGFKLWWRRGKNCHEDAGKVLL
jgi:hypothetical protein